LHYFIIISYILHFIGPSGDPGYEGFIIGTKGESGDRGRIPNINYLLHRYDYMHSVYVFIQVTCI